MKSFLSRGVNKKEKAASVYCKAPFKSMRLGPLGQISICCHNHRDIVGVFPEQSLQEIWNGKYMQQLRKNFADGKPSSACQFCLGNKPADGSLNSNMALYERFSSLEDQPVILDFKADDHCNYACIMCSGLSSSSLRSEGHLRPNPYEHSALLDQLTAWGPKLIEARFSGGEPFLSSLYFSIWDLLIKVNPVCRIVVQTNGSVLNDKIRSLLSRGNFHINISIDSFDEKQYAAIRQGGDLTQVLSNLNWFRDYCVKNSRDFGITSCAMKENRNSWISMVHHWNENEARGWFSPVWFPPSQALWTLPLLELEALRKELISVTLPDQNEIESSNKGALLSLISVLDQMIVLSEKHHHPEKNSLCNHSDFIAAANEMIQGEDLMSLHLKTKILSSLEGFDFVMFNKESFLNICDAASPAVLKELWALMDASSMRLMFKEFIYPKEKAHE